MLLSNLNLLAQAPNGVARLRELILTLAVQGKLVPQDPKDEPASELLKKIRAEKDRLIAEGKIKRDKPLAEIGEKEKPFGLPASWEWVRFGDASINRDGERVPVSSADRDNRAKIYDYYGASGVIDKIDGYLFDKTLLLIGEDGANLINRSTPIAFLANGKYWVNNHAHVIDATHRKLLDYLALFINSISLEPYVTGTAQPKMNQAKLNSILVALPPLAEQSRIVTRVEELMRLCDELEAKGQLEATQHAQLVSTLLATLTESQTPAQLADNWHRIATHFDVLLDRPEAVDALEQTILQLAVRGLLVPQDPQDEPASALLKKIRAEKDKLIAEGKIKRDKPLPSIAEDEQLFGLPEGWEWVRLGNLAELITSGSRDWAEHYSDSGPIFVRMGNLSRGSYELRTKHFQHVRPPHGGEGSRTSLEAGDLLLSITGEVGMLGLIPEGFGEAYINQHTCLIRWLQSVRTEYLPIQLLSTFVQNQFNSPQRGIKNSFRLTDVSGVLLALPPLAEQSRIVTHVAQLRRLCADLRQRLIESNSVHANLAASLVLEAA